MPYEDVRDANGKLLFRFDAERQCVEIKPPHAKRPQVVVLTPTRAVVLPSAPPAEKKV